LIVVGRVESSTTSAYQREPADGILRVKGWFDVFASWRRGLARWLDGVAHRRRAKAALNLLALLGWTRPAVQAAPARNSPHGGYESRPLRPARRDERASFAPDHSAPPDQPLSYNEHAALSGAESRDEARWTDADDEPAPPSRPPFFWDRPEPQATQNEDETAEAGWVRQQQGYLAVKGVEKSFAGRKVVKGVSLYLQRGEAVGLLGPNGAGKTTVFYMITGLVKADRGRIELDGHDITGLPMYQHGRLGIGYLPQEASIFRGLTVEKNIRAVLEQVEPDRRKREAELDALLDEFNITHLRKTPSIALSGGERRRVEIARALATRPSYMLLDEPFAGIDPIAVGDIQALVRHLTQRGIGVLITDHNVRETLGLTDRAYIIYSGEVLMEGNTADIVADSEVRRLYLGEEFRL
jgi:lipopolysaccharide export system ATP-binding protein